MGESSNIRKLHVERSIYKEVIWTTLVKAWKIVKPFAVKDLSSNTFIFSFECHLDMKRIMQWWHWLFDSHVLSLKPFNGLTPPLKMDFSREVFWVQCHNVPIGYMNEKISNTLRVVEACDVEEDGFGLGKVRCLCIEMDLHKPLSQEWTINIQGNWRWMPITYEKLPKLCFRCGRITRGRGDCGGAKGITESATGPYNPWLRAKVGQEHDRGKQNHRPSPSN